MKTEDYFQEHKFYQVLLRSLTDYVIAINRNYHVIMANELFKKEFGMQPNNFCYKLWKNRNEKCEKCLVEQTFKDGWGHWNIENVIMKDGRVAQMLVKSMPVKDEQGEIVYVLETATDITGRLHLQADLEKVEGNLEKMLAYRLEDLQKSEEKYRTIFERSRDAIILTDVDGRITEINQAGVDILEYKTQEEVLARGSVAEIFENKEYFEFHKKISREGFVVEFETRLMGKNDRRFYALITSNVTLDVTGQIVGYVLIIRDITRRKLSQEAINRHNIRLDALNAISKTVSSSLNLDEVLSGTIDKILEVLGNNSVRMYLLDDKQNILKLVAHRGLSNKVTTKPFMKYRKPGEGFLGQTILDGKTRILDNLQRVKDPYVDSIIAEGLHSTTYVPLVTKGKPIGVMCVSRHTPITFSSEHIEFLSAIGNQIGVAVDNANLYENIKRAYQELKEAQEQIVQTEKLASLGKLAATIAHEINNPLAAVLTYIRLMIKLIERNSFSSERLEDISRYLATMDSETSKCGEIVKNLLAFSRQSKISIASHSITGIIDRTLLLIAHDLEIKGIQLEKIIEPNLPHVQCDFKQIQQALLNLINNASDAMQGGGTLKVIVRRRAGTERFLDVMISDTGCGITEKDKEKIFDPFFTTKEEGKGVGLGLSVVYGIVTRHKGIIEVKSEPGKGSTFKVSLPFAVL
ncbi:MAG: PAS domain S-box protein [Desulfobacterales bacterium]|uniref:histidine kinase n=1 Tax=Candidatus Desulfatibia profunda TaxID=2841695 RepID=A0A8J6TIM2_9BACT|nr:PAS domain S-box protein [Candidatus Desulfatibia profunda]MBL7178998.1 PAS domain S-box protein [Desulfobacterales bacterium]